MATILFAWQLGGGLGHLLQNRPLAQGLVKQGHRVFIAFRNLNRAATYYREVGSSFLQAPAKSAGTVPFARGFGFAHLLGNIGFGQDMELFALVSAWRNLFLFARPDLIVFDHSPIALLAARGISARRAVIGSGFCVPPDVDPMPVIRPSADPPPNLDQLAADEQSILQRVNRVLAHWKEPPLKRLAQLYAEVDECFLVTFSELDHFPSRPPGTRYWGPVNGSGGSAPVWPEGKGKRIAAYLKPCPALSAVLKQLCERGNPTLIYSNEIRRRTRERFTAPNVKFLLEPLDPAQVSRECDLAILNATHGSTSDMLLAGKPILQLPMYAEQELLATATARLGAAEVISAKRKDAPGLTEALHRLLSEEHYAYAAREFARHHADFNPSRQGQEMLDRACELLPPSRSPTPPMIGSAYTAIAGADNMIISQVQ